MANPLREFITSQAQGDSTVRSIQEVGFSVQESVTEVFTTPTGGSDGGSGSSTTPPFITDPQPDPTFPSGDGGFTAVQKAIIALAGIGLFSALVGQLFTFEVGS